MNGHRLGNSSFWEFILFVLTQHGRGESTLNVTAIEFSLGQYGLGVYFGAQTTLLIWEHITRNKRWPLNLGPKWNNPNKIVPGFPNTTPLSFCKVDHGLMDSGIHHANNTDTCGEPTGRVVGILIQWICLKMKHELIYIPNEKLKWHSSAESFIMVGVWWIFWLVS
jgi:hypothetical protein